MQYHAFWQKSNTTKFVPTETKMTANKVITFGYIALDDVEYKIRNLLFSIMDISSSQTIILTNVDELTWKLNSKRPLFR